VVVVPVTVKSPLIVMAPENVAPVSSAYAERSDVRAIVPDVVGSVNVVSATAGSAPS